MPPWMRPIQIDLMFFLREIEKSSQVIMATHNRNTMEMATRLYGVTMDKNSISKIVSVDLEDYQ